MEIWKLGVAILIGYVLIGICDGVQQAAAAAGLEVGGVAAGLPDRHGHRLLAGPVRARATPAIPFWWDMLIVAVFSVVIYYWAMATRLPREEMLAPRRAAGRAR